MLRNLLIILFSFLALKVSAENKDKIVKKLKDTDNLNFQFEQNINGKIDNGVCTIEYPKKIFILLSFSRIVKFTKLLSITLSFRLMILLIRNFLSKIKFNGVFSRGYR